MGDVTPGSAIAVNADAYALVWLADACCARGWHDETFLKSAEKLWPLCIAGTALAVSLAIGVWKPSTTEAPVTSWPLGPVVAVILFLEFAWCILGIATVSAKMPR